MVLLTKATNGIATRAEGAFSNCGPGSNGFELSYTCQGPACSSLDGSFLDVICHRDGSSRLICSNYFKCQIGTSTYQSNFTFSQNEPDPWSPVMENEPDTWVPQDQHVLVADCARFSLTSNGTKEGTKVDNEGLAQLCPSVDGASTTGVFSGQISSSAGQPHAAATQRPLIFAGNGSRRTISMVSLVLVFTYIFLLILPGTHASAAHLHYKESLQRHDFRSRATSEKVRAFAQEFRAKIVQRASVEGTDGEAFATNMIANVISSVCGSYFRGLVPSEFTPEVAKSCISSVYGNQPLPQAGLQFFAIIGASLLCDYVISETYPDGQGFLSDGCEGLQDLINEAQSLGSMLMLSTPAAPSVLTIETETLNTQAFETTFSSSRASDQVIFTSIRITPSSSERVSALNTSPPDASLLDILSSIHPFTDTTMISSSINTLASGTTQSIAMALIAAPSAFLSSLVISLVTDTPAIPLLQLSSNLDFSKISLVTSTQMNSRALVTSSPKLSAPEKFDISYATSITPQARPSTSPSQVPESVLKTSKPSVASDKTYSILMDAPSEVPPLALSSAYVLPTITSNGNAKPSEVRAITATLESFSTSSTPPQESSRSETLRTPGAVFSGVISSDDPSSETHTMDALRSDPSIVLDLIVSITSAEGSASVETIGSTGTLLPDLSMSASYDSPSFTSAETNTTPLEVNNPSSSSNREMLASIEVFTTATAVIEATISTESILDILVPSVSISPELGLVDLSTTSWYGDLPSRSSQPSFLSVTPQRSSSSYQPSADRGADTSLSNKLSGSHVPPHVSNNLMPVLSSPNLTEGDPAFSNFTLYLDMSTTMSTVPSFPTSPAVLTATPWSLSRTIATPLTQPLPLIRTLLSPSTEKSTTSLSFMISNFVSNSVLPMTHIVSSTSILVSISPHSSGKSIEPMSNQALTIEDNVLTTIPATTINSAPIFTSSTFAIFNDQPSTSSCSRNFKAPNHCTGSGCVNLMTDKAHCGACDQICEYECYQGTCVCPNFTKPNENNKCMNEPSSGVCVIGSTWNSFKVCAPIKTTTLPRSPTPTWTRPSSLKAAVPSVPLSTSKESLPVSAQAVSTPTPDLRSMYCPPGLPDICSGGCFNTKTEHNHCGGCGNFCSGTCVDGRCLASPTQSRLHLVSARRTVTTESPVRPRVSSTIPPVASYIWKGLAGL